MEFRMAGMNRAAAAEILGWRYEAPYDFYNNAPSEAEEEEELLVGGYAAVRGDGGELAGFFCLGAAARVPNGTYAYGGDWLDKRRATSLPRSSTISTSWTRRTTSSSAPSG